MGPLTKIRRERGLSMSEFARMLGLAVITLVRIEGGVSRLPLKTHPPITKLGLTFFQLMIEQEHYIRTRRRY
jgi:transcriptional regulator with XRE-family HTH domain